MELLEQITGQECKKGVLAGLNRITGKVKLEVGLVRMMDIYDPCILVLDLSQRRAETIGPPGSIAHWRLGGGGGGVA